MKTLKLLTTLIIIALSIHIGSAEETADAGTLAGDGTLRRIRVPILMYHYVGALPSDADDVRINLTISTDYFREHLEFLKSEGYSTISLYEIAQALTNGTQLPLKPIVLSFDDGHIDHYTNAYPLLKEFGYTGTFFIITQFADDNVQGHLTWEQIQEMAANGMSIESHTKTHPNLQDRDNDFLVYQILGSVESLEYYTQQDIYGFSYPAGRYDENVINLLKTTNIQFAVTTQYGAYHTSTDMLEAPRLRITNNMNAVGLASLLNSVP